jgi:hypothetical protein
MHDNQLICLDMRPASRLMDLKGNVWTWHKATVITFKRRRRWGLGWAITCGSMNLSRPVCSSLFLLHECDDRQNSKNYVKMTHL